MSTDLTILALQPGQKIARLFREASSFEEAVEHLACWKALKESEHLGFGKASRLAKKAMEAASIDTNAIRALMGKIDSEEPVLVHAGVKFFIFRRDY